MLDKLAQIALPETAWIEMPVCGGDQEKRALRDDDTFDVDDDLALEFAFHEEALESANWAEAALRDAGIPYKRPDDYFAECMKTDAHMLRVKARLLREKQAIEAAERARKQRDLRKFGKQAQVQQKQAKDMKRSAQLKALGKWRKQRNNALEDGGAVGTHEVRDVPEHLIGGGGGGAAGGAPRKSAKRKAKDMKYGLGGKKRGMNKNTAESAWALDDDFSAARNNRDKRAWAAGRGGGKKKNAAAVRPGKRRRTAMKNRRKGK